MLKPLGGRGKKAPYETCQVRVPVPIKPQVEKLIEDFRNSILNDSVASESDSSTAEIEQCLKLVDRFIEASNLTEKLIDRKRYRNVWELARFREWLRSLNSPTESDTL